MKNLLIIGAGGCGREVLQWAKDINSVERKWNIKGFLNDIENALDNVNCDCKIISSIKDYVIEEDDEFVCAIGDSHARKVLTQMMQEKGAKFTNIIHPTAVVADTAELGEGVVLYPFSIISDNAHIGDGTIVNMYSSIAHDSKVGEYCTISAHCDVTGKCVLGDEVFMGTSSNVIPTIKVGNNVYICAGSTVMTKVRDNSKVMGIPAKKLSF